MPTWTGAYRGGLTQRWVLRRSWERLRHSQPRFRLDRRLSGGHESRGVAYLL